VTYPSGISRQVSRGRAQYQLGAPHPAMPHCHPLHQTLIMDHIIREANETELHPNSMNREDCFCLSKSQKPPICYLKCCRKPPQHESRTGFSIGPRRSIHTARIRAQTMPSPGTHQLPPQSAGFLLLPPLSHPPPHACNWLTSHRFPSQHTLTPFAVFLLDQQNHPLSGPHQLLFSSPTGSIGGCVRAQQFHSVPQGANGNSDLLFQLSSASYIIQNFWTAVCLTCHLLSHWHLARLI
jgi:hypothetical protein